MKIHSTHTDKTSFHEDLNILDNRGRRIGAVIAHFTAAHAAVTDDAECYQLGDVGVFAGWNVQTTRNGVPYGAVQPDRFSADSLSRIADVQVHIDRMAARYRKQFA